MNYLKGTVSIGIRLLVSESVTNSLRLSKGNCIEKLTPQIKKVIDFLENHQVEISFKGLIRQYETYVEDGKFVLDFMEDEYEVEGEVSSYRKERVYKDHWTGVSHIEKYVGDVVSSYETTCYIDSWKEGELTKYIATDGIEGELTPFEDVEPYFSDEAVDIAINE